MNERLSRQNSIYWPDTIRRCHYRCEQSYRASKRILLNKNRHRLNSGFLGGGSINLGFTEDTWPHVGFRELEGLALIHHRIAGAVTKITVIWHTGRRCHGSCAVADSNRNRWHRQTSVIGHNIHPRNRIGMAIAVFLRSDHLHYGCFCICFRSDRAAREIWHNRYSVASKRADYA